MAAKPETALRALVLVALVGLVLFPWSENPVGAATPTACTTPQAHYFEGYEYKGLGLSIPGVRSDVQAESVNLCNSGTNSDDVASAWVSLTSDNGGFSRVGYYKDETNNGHALKWFFEWRLSGTSTPVQFDGSLGGLYPQPGDYHNLEVFVSTLSTHHLKIKVDGTEWTSAEANFNVYTNWPAIIPELSTEQFYNEGDMMGQAYPNRTSFDLIQLWNGSSWSTGGNNTVVRSSACSDWHLNATNTYSFLVWTDPLNDYC